jgi:hypothetical protein
VHTHFFPSISGPEAVALCRFVRRRVFVFVLPFFVRLQDFVFILPFLLQCACQNLSAAVSARKRMINMPYLFDIYVIKLGMAHRPEPRRFFDGMERLDIYRCYFT